MNIVIKDPSGLFKLKNSHGIRRAHGKPGLELRDLINRIAFRRRHRSRQVLSVWFLWLKTSGMPNPDKPRKQDSCKYSLERPKNLEDIQNLYSKLRTRPITPTPLLTYRICLDQTSSSGVFISPTSFSQQNMPTIMSTLDKFLALRNSTHN